MSLSEFELIKKYFCQNDRGTGIELGIGDDCALLNLPENKTLAITTDTQIEGIHFFSNTSPYYVGYKSLLVNLSDLAAMGAKPYCFTLSLTLPEANEDFLKEFSKGDFITSSMGCRFTTSSIFHFMNGMIPQWSYITRESSETDKREYDLYLQYFQDDVEKDLYLPEPGKNGTVQYKCVYEDEKGRCKEKIYTEDEMLEALNLFFGTKMYFGEKFIKHTDTGGEYIDAVALAFNLNEEQTKKLDKAVVNSDKKTASDDTLRYCFDVTDAIMREYFAHINK